MVGLSKFVLLFLGLLILNWSMKWMLGKILLAKKVLLLCILKKALSGYVSLARWTWLNSAVSSISFWKYFGLIQVWTAWTLLRLHCTNGSRWLPPGEPWKFFPPRSNFHQIAHCRSTIDQGALPVPVLHSVKTMTAIVCRAVITDFAINLIQEVVLCLKLTTHPVGSQHPQVCLSYNRSQQDFLLFSLPWGLKKKKLFPFFI